MVSAFASHSSLAQRGARHLAAVTATSLAAGMQKVTRTVMSQGAVVITRHDEPTMVLMSIERYLELEQAAEPNLDTLTHRFDDLFAQMQGDAAAQAMSNALAMSPTELGAAAVQAAQGAKKPVERSTD